MADIGTVNRQISLPFQFGSDGSVMTTTDINKQTADHVYSVVGTQVSERVMLPTYGTNIMPFLWAPLDDLTEQDVTNQISSALQVNAPEVTLQSVDFASNPGTGSLYLNVNYALAGGDSTTSTATVPVTLNS